MAGDGQPSCASSSVPVSALQQFLAALRAKDFDGAKALAFQILTDEPRNESVLRSLPVIEHCLRLAQQPASAELESEDEESSSEDGGDDGDDDDDDDDDGDDDGDDDDGDDDDGGDDDEDGGSCSSDGGDGESETDCRVRQPAVNGSAAVAAAPDPTAVLPEDRDRLRALMASSRDLDLKKSLRSLVLSLESPDS